MSAEFKNTHVLGARRHRRCVIGWIGIFSIGMTAHVARSDVDSIAPELHGVALRQYLRQHYVPRRALSYKSARKQMFSRIDNRDGKVRLVYTGVEFATRDIPNHTIVNTEHTWPQSKFGRASDRQRMKSDLHHLFPTYNRVNGARGNSRFAEIPDQQTQAWWRAASASHGIPSADIDEYSESIPSAFEPREDHKGNVARAMFYFYITYEDRGIDSTWFLPQIETMRTWNKLDQVDEAERRRSKAIAGLQGNENPFVLDPTLIDRVLDVKKDAEDEKQPEGSTSASTSNEGDQSDQRNERCGFGNRQNLKRPADDRVVESIDEITVEKVGAAVADSDLVVTEFGACVRIEVDHEMGDDVAH